MGSNCSQPSEILTVMGNQMMANDNLEEEMDVMNDRSPNQNLDNILNETFRNIRTSNFNILVVGNTGVGKSTLINEAFEGHMANPASTGIGLPQTQRIQQYSLPDLPITIFDTKGLETNDEIAKNVSNGLLKFVEEKKEKTKIRRAITRNMVLC